MSRLTPATVALLLCCVARPALSQSARSPSNVGGRAEVFAGGELENYLRYLQSVGEVAPYPWGLRAFSPAELDRLMPRDTAHPWAARYDWTAPRQSGPSVDWVAPTASVRVNSTFPFGYNDGPVWAGRGLTMAAQAGAALRWGPLSITVAPMVFEAQNAAFPLQPNGQAGNVAYANAAWYTYIDLPQRFGGAAYRRLDPGQSSARIDWGPVAFGVTTANQYWGPATGFPLILGNNAAGVPEAFAGTAHPLDLWLLRLHVRLTWGREGESAYFPDWLAIPARFAAGLDLNLTSRWIPGLEVGVVRYSHQPWPAGGFWHADFLHVLRYQQAANAAHTLLDAQLASAYFRWVLPHSGFEVYGEYGRNDYAQDLRDLIQEPDHKGAYMVGFRKVARHSADRLVAVRAELQNMQPSSLAQGRETIPFYTNAFARQGHTQLGQELGSGVGLGGAASVVAVDAYSRAGRWTFSWTRILQAQRATYSAAGGVLPPASQPDSKALDVQHEFAVERLMFLGRCDLLAHVGGVYELNRYFQHNAFNLNLIVSVRYGL